MELFVADAFAWLREEARAWPYGAMLYLGPLEHDELDMLVARLAAARGFYLEFARAGLPVADEERLGRELGVRSVDATPSDDDVERIVLAR